MFFTYNFNFGTIINIFYQVIIISKEHGGFLQNPQSHLNGHSCKKCSDDKYRFTLEEFIQRAKKIHGNLYDYSLTEYKGNKIKVKIICKNHGIFYQSPNEHLDKSGCDKCARKRIADNQRFTTEYFIQKAIEIHGQKYNYSLVVVLWCTYKS